MPIRREIYTTIGTENQCVCGQKSSTIDPSRLVLDINDDFKLIFVFTDNQTTPPSLIPMDLFDLFIDFYIEGKDAVYKVAKRGKSLVNCMINPKESTLKAIIDNHRLPSGNLWARFEFQFPDRDYPDGYGRSIVTQDMGITLVDNSN